MANYVTDDGYRFCSSCLESRTARDLGVVIDSQLSLSAHVAAVCRCGYYQLRQLRQAVRSLSEDASKTLVQAFVSCRMGYCNSVLRHLGRPDEPIAVGSERHRPSGYWYSTFRPYNIGTGYRIRQRVDFKVATLVHRSLSSISPSYLADDCRLVTDARERWLRSTASRICVKTQTYSTFGDTALQTLQLLDPDYGTVFHRTWKRRTYYRTIHCVSKNGPTL